MAAAAMIQNMASMYNQPASYQMQSYIPDAHKIAQAIFASVGGILGLLLLIRIVQSICCNFLCLNLF